VSTVDNFIMLANFVMQMQQFWLLWTAVCMTVSPYRWIHTNRFSLL